MGTENLKWRKDLHALGMPGFENLKLTNGLAELLQLVDGIWKSVLNENADANWKGYSRRKKQKKKISEN